MEASKKKDPLHDYRQALERAFSGRLKKIQNEYFEIPTSLFVSKLDLKMPSLPEIAFYIEKDGKIEILKKPDQKYSTLALSAHENILIHEKDFPEIRRFAEARILSDSAPSGKLPTAERMEVLRRAAITTVEDLFNNPSPENVNKSKKVVSSFVYVLMKEPEAYLYLARLSSHDPYTLQHSVGTSVNSIILGRKIGITEEKVLEELGMGGLLHDIGKVKVRREIINKEGPLDEKEWEEMQQHSAMGYEIVKDNPQLSERTKLAILEHHEDKTGKGYPQGLPWQDVDRFAKLVAISDIFNALTTDRSYSKARTPFDAFKLMRDKLSHKIDDDLFRLLVEIYGGDFRQVA